MSVQGIPTSPRVLILGGDALVGRALDVTLRDAGYDSQFLNGSFFDAPIKLLDGARLVILAPRLACKRRESLLSTMSNTPAASEVTVMELATSVDEACNGQTYRVMWPCPIKDLMREIEAALLSGPQGLGIEQAGGG